MIKSDMDAMSHAVMFKGPHDTYWTTIAAFNCFSAALAYAKECGNGWGENGQRYYRVEITPAEMSRQDAQELAELRDQAKRANWSYVDDNEE